MKRLYRNWIVVGAATTVVLLAANVALTLVNTRRLHEHAALVTHTHDVVIGLQEILSLAKDAETGQRGFLITGEAPYLAPYSTAVAAINNQVDAVEQLTADNPVQQARFPELRERVARRLKILADGIAARDTVGFEAARQIILSDRGKVEMDALRATIGEMTSHEDDLLAMRERELAQTYRTAITAGSLSGLAAMLAIGGFMLLLWRHLAARSAAAFVISEQAERLRTTLASIGDAVITTDTDGRVTNMNAVAESLTGWTTREALGKSLDSVFQIVNEETRKPVENPATRALREGVIVGLANHTVLIARDDTERPIDDSAAPIRCKDGEIVGCVLVFRDVTARRQVERELRVSETRKTAMFETTLDCIISINCEGTIIEFNTAAERTLGYRREDVLGRELAAAIIPPVYRESHRQGLIRYLATGEGPVLNQRLELSALRADGTEFPIELTVTRIPVDGPAQFTAYLRDITDRKRAEEKLLESESRFRALADNIPQLAWIADAGTDGQVHWFNKSWFEYTGTTLEEMQGSGWQKVHHPEHAERVVQKFQRHVREGLDWEDTFPLRDKDGQYRWFLSRMNIIRDDSGNVVRIFGTNTDVTEQRQMADALRQNAADMSEADRRKNEFIAMLAHELRNPLAPIRNAVQVLQLAEGNHETVKSVSEMMERQIAQLVRLVDDLLDVSRITRGKIELRRERVELAKVVNLAVEAAESLISCIERELTVKMPPQPMYLKADPTRLAQVIGNLLNNACKFTKDGGRIDLIVERDGNEAVLRVRDDGIGIAAEQRPKIFDMFMQVDTTLERTVSGLGIGLTLVKNLVELHDGSVTVDSDGLGHGADFVVRLPILTEPVPAPTSDPVSLRPSTVAARSYLVVDDNRDSAMSLAALLKISGNEVRIAHDGIEAVELAKEFHPDVVLLDIGLPKLNGYEVCRHIREQPWGKDMIVVAITGWGQDDDRQKSLSAGFNGHLVKPVDHAALTKLLADL